MDTNSKLNASLACTRFNQLISTGVGLKGVEYTCNFDTDDIVIPRRNYHAIKIKRFAGEVTHERRMKIIHLFGMKSPFITSVKFISCNISQFWIGKMLSFLPQTSSLSFKNCNINPSMLFTPSLPALESLEVEQNVFPLIFQMLNGVDTLKKVRLSPNMRNLDDELDDENSDTDDENPDLGNLSDDENSSDMDEEMIEVSDRNYYEFLARQRHLKSLSISEGSFFNQRFTHCRFQLEEIDLFFRVGYEQSVFLLAFIREQLSFSNFSANIKHCDCVPFQHRNLQEVIGLVLHTETLKKFRWIFYETETLQFYKDCKIVNENVKQLYLYFCGMDFYHQRIVEATTKMFPKVESLHLNLDDPWLNRENTTRRTFEPLNGLAELKDLKLEHLESRCITFLKLPKIESFLLIRNPDKDKGQTKANWECFYKNNPRYHQQQQKPKGTFSLLKKFVSCIVRALPRSIHVFHP